MNAIRYFNPRYWAQRYFATRPYIGISVVVYVAIRPFVADARRYNFDCCRQYLFVAAEYNAPQRTEIVFVAERNFGFTAPPYRAVIANTRSFDYTARRRRFLFVAEQPANFDSSYKELPFVPERTYDFSDSARMGTI